MELPGVGDELEVLAGPQQAVGQVDGFEVRHVHVRRAMEHQERTLDTVHPVGRRPKLIHGGVLLRSSHAAFHPASARITEPEAKVPDAGDVHSAGKQGRIEGQRLHRHEASVAEAPDADAIRVHELQGLQVFARRGDILVVPSSHVAVRLLPEVAAVSDAAAIVGHEHDVSLGNEELVERVVHPVVAADMPAVIVLRDPVAMYPDDGGMPDGTVEPVRHEEIARDLSPVAGRVADELALGEERRVERLGQ